MFEFLRPSYWLILGVALMLATLPSSQAGSTLNLNFSPFDGGNSTLVSWNLSGDVVSENGAELYAATSPIRLLLFGITTTGLFNEAYRTTLISTPSTSGQGVGYVFTGPPYGLQGGTVSIVESPSSQRQLLDLRNSVGFDVVDEPVFFNGIPLGSIATFVPNNQDIVSLNLVWTSLVTPVEPAYLSVESGNHIRYTPNVDSVDPIVIPLAFSNFNVGTYDSGISTSLYVSGFRSVLNVVPEPSTYVLFGFGALVLLAINRRRKFRN